MSLFSLMENKFCGGKISKIFQCSQKFLQINTHKNYSAIVNVLENLLPHGNKGNIGGHTTDVEYT